MLLAIYKLHFTTAVHFGGDEGGDHLTSVRMAFRADTLFSALYIEAIKVGMQDAFLDAVTGDTLLFSDAFPWKGQVLYLPRPVGQFAPPAREADPSNRKLMKKIEYIPLDMLDDYLHGRSEPEKLSATFGHRFETTRVNKRDFDDPLPYQTGAFRFVDDAGLYVLAAFRNSRAEELMDELMLMLSGHGIGGKVSSGWGKFVFEKVQPGAQMAAMVNNTGARRQLLLSTAWPQDEQLEAILCGAAYTLVRRGGFSAGDQLQPTKKRTTYHFGAGSTFSERFSGVMTDVNLGLPHPVYRYGKALFMGVDPE